VRRLSARLPVTVTVGEKARVDCIVAAVNGNEAVLVPDRRVNLAALAEQGPEAFISFMSSGRLAAIRGRVVIGPGPEDLRFRAADHAQMPNVRRVARLDVAVGGTLTPLDAAGNPAAPPRAIRTKDISARGALISGAADVPVATEISLTLDLLRGHDPLKFRSRVVRQVGQGLTALEHLSAEGHDLEVLRDLIDRAMCELARPAADAA
jgi:PilZ domain